MRCRKEFPENVQHKHHHKTEQHDFCRRLDWSPSWWGPEGIMWCLWLVMLFIDVYRCLSFFLHAAQEVERTVFYGFGCAPWQHPSRALVLFRMWSPKEPKSFAWTTWHILASILSRFPASFSQDCQHHHLYQCNLDTTTGITIIESENCLFPLYVFVCFCVLLHSMALLELMIGEGSGVIRNECLVTILFWRLPWSQAIFLGLSMDYSDGSLPWTICDLVPCQLHQLKLSVRNWWYAWCMLILWGVFLHFCHRDLLQGAVILQGSVICLPTCSLGFVYLGFCRSTCLAFPATFVAARLWWIASWLGCSVPNVVYESNI